jgi:hypothetical protein
MRRIGFSTGAIARGDFRGALAMLTGHGVDAVELSALRVDELDPLVNALPTLNLRSFNFVSVHAPSRFDQSNERAILESLSRIPGDLPIVVHPDVLFTPDLWRAFGSRLLIENMDKRKPVGRTVTELVPLFTELPEARFCFDVGHARQVDPSMTESVLLLREFGSRLAEVHISEVNTSSRHDPISTSAVQAFQSICRYIPEVTPIVIESLIDEGQSDVLTELRSAREALEIEPMLVQR